MGAAEATRLARRQAPASGFGRWWVAVPARPHERLAITVILGACLAHLLGGALPWEIEVALVAVAVLTSLPHGGADLPVAAALLQPRFGRAWLPIFAAGYLALAIGVLLLWWRAPGLALSGFLLLSALHFGTTDVSEATTLRPLAVAVRGGAPIIVPAIAHPAELAELFRLLAGTEGETIVQACRGVVAIGWVGATAAYLLLLILNGRTPRRLLEFAVVCAGFALLPPLLAFSLYFGLLHAPRAMIGTAERSGTTVAALVRSSAMPTIAALLLFLLAFWIVSIDAGQEEAAIVTLFVGLAALTVPHMALEAGLRTAPYISED